MFQGAYVTMNEGVLLSPEDCTPEAIAVAWDEIDTHRGLRVLENGMEQSHRALSRLSRKS